MKTVNIKGVDYQLMFKMGAVRILKNEFDKEFEDIKSLLDMVEFIFCCAKCTARLENKDFKITIEDFADSLDLGQTTDLFSSLVEGSGVEIQKSVQKKSRTSR